MEVDKRNMRKVLLEFPEQVIKGFGLSNGIKVNGKEITSIVISGMGGSALPGEILKSYVDGLKIPVSVVKDYFIPEAANSKTLVFSISFSGNTEETLNACRHAVRKGCKVIAISSGGKLKLMAQKQKIDHITVPAGMQPRCAYGYLTFAMLRVLQDSGILEDQTGFVEKTAALLKMPAFEENGRQLAEKLTGRIPLIYSSERMAAVAYKWKISFNENAKVHAFCNTFPELNHNELVGYTKLNGSYSCIIIKSEDDYDRVRKRMAITKDIIKSTGVPVLEIAVSGPCLLARIISAIYTGDWASYYLALNQGIDPTPVELVEELKSKL